MNKKIIKVCIFDSHSTPSQVKLSNGDAILDNILIHGVVDEHLETGEHYLDAIFSVDDERLWEHIQEESILKVSVDYGEEYFRIAQIQSTSNYITVVARQETIHQTLHMWLSDVRPENQTGQGALSWMKDYAEGPKDITVLSDIPTISTAYYMDMNMYQAIHDCDQSFSNRWGGEIQRRGYTLRINQKIGTNRGVQIRSNKNLTGFEADTNIDKVFTRLKPKGYDGITIDGYVDSTLISNYPFIKTYDPKYDDVKVKDGNSEEGYDTLAQAQAELIRRAQLEFSQNNIDKIKADYRINFLKLEQTEEYKDYVAAERIFLGDEVDVYEEKLGINITVRAKRRSYDIIRQKVIEIELSNEVVREKPPSLEDLIDRVEGLEDGLGDNFENIFNQAKEDATNIINAGMKDSYVVVRKNEILIMDTTDINTATNVWRWNRGGLGFSSTGYYGQYGTAITSDGKIVADFITAGVLNAGLIKTGILKNYNNDFELNLDAGTVKINNNNFKVVVDGKEEGVVSQSRITQLNDSWNATFTSGYEQGIVKMNKDGIEINHTNSGASKFSSTGLAFYDSTGIPTVKMQDGGFNFYSANGINEFVGVLKPTSADTSYINGLTLALSTVGDYFDIAYYDSENAYNSALKIIPHNGSSLGNKGIYFNSLDIFSKNKITVENDVVVNNVRGNNSAVGIWGQGNYGGVAINSNIGYFMPMYDLKLACGHPNFKWTTIHLQNAPTVASDVRLKENIRYIEENVGIEDVTTLTDMHDFIKSDLKIANYNYKCDDADRVGLEYAIGFIAQDLLGSKIGELIVNRDVGEYLSYNTQTYTNVIAGALKEEINIRDRQIDDLKNRIERLESLLYTLEGECLNA